MNHRARQMNMNPEEVSAVTLGDTIMVRQSYANNARTLAEELAHVRQQLSGRGSSTNIAQMEIEARQYAVQSAQRYGLTGDEVTALLEEIRVITERGTY